MRTVLCWLSLLFLASPGLTAQSDTTAVLAAEGGAELPIGTLRSVWPDRFDEFDLLDYDGERAGELRLRFPPVAGRGGDFTQWTFRFDDRVGDIRPTGGPRGAQFEVRVDGQAVTVSPLFPGQFDQWQITNGRSRIVYAVRDYNLLEYWSTRGPGGPGNYEVYTSYEGDPREWVIFDETTQVVTAPEQLAMLWLPLYLRLLPR